MPRYKVNMQVGTGRYAGASGVVTVVAAADGPSTELSFEIRTTRQTWVGSRWPGRRQRGRSGHGRLVLVGPPGSSSGVRLQRGDCRRC